MENVPVAGPCMLAKRLEQPWWGGAINIPIPGRALIPKKHPAEGLQLDRVGLGNTNDPGRQQFVLKRLGMGWPHLAVGHLSPSAPCDVLMAASNPVHPESACR